MTNNPDSSYIKVLMVDSLFILGQKVDPGSGGIKDSISLNPDYQFLSGILEPYTYYADSLTGEMIFTGKNGQIRYVNATNDIPFLNTTGTTLYPWTPLSTGSVVFNKIRGLPSVKIGLCDSLNLMQTLQGIPRDTVYPGEVGIIQKQNFNGNCAPKLALLDPQNGNVLYADCDSAFTNIKPEAPAYATIIGFADFNTGIVAVSTSQFTGSDTDVNWQGGINGIVTNQPSISDTVIAGIPYVEIGNGTYPGKNLPFMISGERYELNTTTNIGTDGKARIQLSYGTDTLPLKLYVYIQDWESTPTLAVSTVGYPSGNPQVSAFGLYSESKHALEGFAYVRRVNNEINGSAANGIIAKLANRIRLLGSIITSGVTPTVSIIGSPGIDTLIVTTTSGVGYQLNEQIINEITPPYIWENSPNGGDSTILSLSEINIAADGTPLVSNNSRYRLNLRVRINSGEYPCVLAVSVSNGTYSSDDDCINDVGLKSVTEPALYANDISVRYIAIPVRYNTSGGGTITNLLGDGGFQNELNFPFGFGGVGSSSGGGTISWPVSDATFSLSNNSDPTKTGIFSLLNVLTGTNEVIDWHYLFVEQSTILSKNLTEDVYYTGAGAYSMQIGYQNSTSINPLKSFKISATDTLQLLNDFNTGLVIDNANNFGLKHSSGNGFFSSGITPEIRGDALGIGSITTTTGFKTINGANVDFNSGSAGSKYIRGDGGVGLQYNTEAVGYHLFQIGNVDKVRINTDTTIFYNEIKTPAITGRYWRTEQKMLVLDSIFWVDGGVDSLITEPYTSLVPGSLEGHYSGLEYNENTSDSITFEVLIDDTETAFGILDKATLTKSITNSKMGTSILRTIDSDFPGTKLWIRNKPGAFSDGNRILVIYYEVKTFINEPDIY